MERIEHRELTREGEAAQGRSECCESGFLRSILLGLSYQTEKLRLELMRE